MSFYGMIDAYGSEEALSKEFLREYARRGYLNANVEDVISEIESSSPSFLTNFGKSLKTSGLDDDGLHRVMAKVSVNVVPYGSTPSIWTFFEKLAEEPSSFQTLAPKVAEQTIKDTFAFSKKALLIGGLVLGGVLLIKLGLLNVERHTSVKGY